MKKQYWIYILAIIIVLFLLSCMENEFIPETKGLPFEFVREESGTPLTQEEITAFTKKITGVWKNTNYFDFIDMVSYGVNEDNPYDYPYFSCIYTCTHIVREGDQMILRSAPTGGSDNATLRHIGVLLNLINARFLTDNQALEPLIDRLARGISANIMAMEWGDNVPESDKYILARYLVPPYFHRDLGDGRTITIDMSTWEEETWGYFSDMIINPVNPYWGNIFVKAKRSKDDVCHVFYAMGLIPFYLNQFTDEVTNEAVAKMLEDVSKFAKDVVDAGYNIRTRDHDGTIFIPNEDFASLNSYTWVDPNAECNARLSSAFLGYSNTQGIDCGNGVAAIYEDFATMGHIFNYTIIRHFHLAAILQALHHNENNIALKLLEGLADRMEKENNTEPEDIKDQNVYKFNRKLAGRMVRYAIVGLPLTSDEVRFIYEEFEKGIDYWNSWEYWDIWSLEDGTYQDGNNYYPASNIDLENMTSFFTYCNSPYRNETGVPIVDCDIIRDPSQWGE